MQSAPLHPREADRLAELDSYDILDSLPEEDYDNLVELASYICDTEMSLISLIDRDRQWFKARHGLEVTETARDYAFCAHAIHNEQEIMVVENARSDQRFHDNPLVTGPPNISFYAGVPLVSPKGLPLGTLCVLDSEHKKLSAEQEKCLANLAKQVINLLELRRRTDKLELLLQELAERNESLDQFAMLAAHDIKTPLSNIHAITALLKDELGASSSSSSQEFLEMIALSSEQLNKLVDRLLAYSKADKMLKNNKSLVSLSRLKDELLSFLPAEKGAELQLESELDEVEVNQLVLSRVLLNLITNAVKYNDKPKLALKLKIENQKEFWRFELADNGPGIPRHLRETIFELFSTGQAQDRFGNAGTGIGLASVRRMIESLGGEIYVSDHEGEGACFTFRLPK